MKDRLILSAEELEILFPNEIQREIFIKFAIKFSEIINERTVHLPFVAADRIS